MLSAKTSKAIKYLKSYAPGLFKGKYKLDANENSYDVPVNVKIKILKEAKEMEFNRYPDPFADKLCNALSKRLNVSPRNMLIGNGSDELIYYLLLSFIERNDNVLVPYPTFEMYKILSKICGANVTEVLLSRKRNFDLDMEKMINVIKGKKTKFVFIAYPNNPTGNCFSADAIKRILKEKETFVVIDEAYFEFSGKTFLKELNKYENLIILRTFSKAFSLAGLRIGYMMADESVINVVKKVKLPYNVNSFSQTAAYYALKCEKQFKKNVEMTIKERETMKEELKGLYYFPDSDSNFIFLKIRNPGLLKKEFIKNGICVRFFKDSRLKNFVRITVGRRKENKIVTDILKKGF